MHTSFTLSRRLYQERSLVYRTCSNIVRCLEDGMNECIIANTSTALSKCKELFEMLFTCLILRTALEGCSYPHFTDKETEPQRS